MYEIRSDITLIHYTANRIHPEFARNVQNHLLEVTKNQYPIISVSQKPMDFGDTNILVGEIGYSNYNIYLQILIGLRETKTEYVACSEDDTLYCPEHFQYRPPLDKIAYNMNRWNITPSGVIYYRERAVMSQCIASTSILRKHLEQRYDNYPEFQERMEKYWGEPSRYDESMKCDPVQFELFKTETPTLVFKHRDSLGSVRNRRDTDEIVQELPPYGKAVDILARFYRR
jgi:hypothetical protein